MPIAIPAIAVLAILIVAYIILRLLVEYVIVPFLQALYSLLVHAREWWWNTAWPWLRDVAWPWVKDTANDVWDSVTMATDEVITRARTQIQDLNKEIERIKDKILEKERVYRIFMKDLGTYIDKKRKKKGQPREDGTIDYDPDDPEQDDTYKYGTTKNTVEQRYSASSIIGKEIRPGGRMGYVYLTPFIEKLRARLIEKMLIVGYYVRHGAFPPGNTKLG